ncbi:urease subunit beta [Georgenia sp. SUBG003]|uniref:urease subunit beta n=1 Tax=Georgenia sp. SUBG003 TaxID=1497974 RepID=UPI003AB52280
MAGISTTGPGAVRVRPGTVELNADRTPEERREFVVLNTGDRPVQIGSHLHLPDANPALDLDRAGARGFRLDIPSGTSRRFEPGGLRRRPGGRAARRPRASLAGQGSVRRRD